MNDLLFDFGSLSPRYLGLRRISLSLLGMRYSIRFLKWGVNKRKTNAAAILKIVCAFAICCASLPPIYIINLEKGVIKGKSKRTPITLNIECARAALLAKTLSRIEDMNAVTVVPIFEPSRIGKAWLRLIMPLIASTTTIPVVMALDWTVAVTKNPARRAINTFDSLENKSNINGSSLIGRTASDIILSPKKRRPK